MRFKRVGEVGPEIPVVVQEDSVLDLRGLTTDLNPAFFSQYSLEDIEKHISSLPELQLPPGSRTGAPVAGTTAVYCIGMNYAKHALEGGSPPPEQIVMFMKPPHTITGPNDPLRLHQAMRKVDWEVELALVIGRECSRLSESDDALDYVFGACLANDLSERRWQLEDSGGQWSKGKSAPGFLPLGPDLVPLAGLDLDNLGLRSFVNGEARQDSNTKDMIFSPEQIVRDLSQVTVLRPGDILLTGTPEGVAFSGRFPYLAVGDNVTIEIDGLGTQSLEVVSGSMKGDQHDG